MTQDYNFFLFEGFPNSGNKFQKENNFLILKLRMCVRFYQETQTESIWVSRKKIRNLVNFKSKVAREGLMF